MGITVHYRFAFRDGRSVVSALNSLQEYCEIKRVKFDRVGPTHLRIDLHPKCEPLDLEFKKHFEWFVDEKTGYQHLRLNLHEAAFGQMTPILGDEEYSCASFCKTQGAGLKVHIIACELLRFIAGRAMLSIVSDEADYFESADFGKAAERFNASEKMIADVQRFVLGWRSRK